ncbi:MAG: hypothetical protein A2537_01250 [Candidatus Magasanikbacteria bacterium RIFOXYD2_FULL_36_9]|uniref:Uncharacterized protein n=1 Tax=Candidatus Magasanikbacteria bacterium RIFOXYD2_FULL_36_9 TaxID=1798707 RepID=A0A1F6NYL6_9BACT|nr:MAG: hypothetical protein A2537_01250 [Candidatus Magasanikbacteria bacterium RIFOXYD2_FULL_36_9]
MVGFLNRFNPFKNNSVDGNTEEKPTFTAEEQTYQNMDTEAQTKVKSTFTAQEWNGGPKGQNDPRPKEYLTASKLINIAHEMGFKTSDSIGLEMRDRWNELIRKARAYGLNEAEVTELKEISNIIIDKLKVKTGTIPDVSE